ncbi:MAG TPA: SufD family Fe-S cluster assembly protein [Pseudothermotoga sp.]|nr:SufD family Fe-S cluster assembly protein [Pseudothermotoga sp.]HOK82673.1 SufD family Fe-S cluster assembly protein [Pseudothermotoga sp.]HPP70434.1 SufD family Fe-S cluster assembly protein [Pseudothermotoga sp.]
MISTVDQKKEFEMLKKAYEKAGGDVSKFLDKRVASLIISGDKVIGLNGLQGVEIIPEKIENGVKAKILVSKNTLIQTPIHICTGYVEKKGLQRVIFEIEIGENSQVRFVAHCTFPWVEEFTHDALALVHVGKNSKMYYSDEHYHSNTGSITLNTTTRAIVEENGLFVNNFTLTKTRIGRLRLDASVQLGQNAVADLSAKVKASRSDQVLIREKLDLVGSHSSGMAKTTVVALDESKVRVVNEAYGIGSYSKGHIRCEEITKGEGVDVSTIPVLKVMNELAELTHEASIGRVNANQLQTLMAKGLSEEEATELIIKGLVG